jgi:exportin-7
MGNDSNDGLGGLNVSQPGRGQTGGQSSGTGQTLLLARINAHRNLFPDVLRTLFEIVLFEDCANQWSLSRPMLSLILGNETAFGELKSQITLSAPPGKRQEMALAFEKLMHEVGRELTSRNRDRFTQNLTVFRHEAKA